MRRLTSSCLAALVGAALASPALAQEPGPEADCPVCQGQTTDTRHHHVFSRRGMSPEEQLARVRAKAARDGAVLIIEGTPPPSSTLGGLDCQECQQTYSNQGPVTVYHSEDAAGYAHVGSEAPGVASFGGLASTEPAPIGVVQTNYSGQSFHATPAGPVGTNPAYGPGMAAIPAAPMPTMPQHRRPHILGDLLGLPRMGSWREARREARRSQHAAISYGKSVGPVTELPASVVYERR